MLADDDDDDDDHELFLWYGWAIKKSLALFPARTIVRNPHCDLPHTVSRF